MVQHYTLYTNLTAAATSIRNLSQAAFIKAFLQWVSFNLKKQSRNFILGWSTDGGLVQSCDPILCAN